MKEYKHIGIMYDNNAANARIAYEELDKLLKTIGIAIIGAPVTAESDFEAVADDLSSQKA